MPKPPTTIPVSFWCSSCSQDFDAPAYKDSRSDWGNPTGPRIEFFVGFCPRGHRALRYITEARIDPYFLQSKKLRIQREMMKKDLLQPGQFGFKTLYPKAWADIEKASEDYELKQKASEASQLAFYRKYKHDVNERALARKIIDAENKLSGRH